MPPKGLGFSINFCVDAVVLIATLGGYKARSCDSPPEGCYALLSHERDFGKTHEILILG